MKKTYYSNGKLLITAEYVVLDGALAFALPTKFGQNLIVEESKTKTIQWKSIDHDGTIWFEETIPFDEIQNPGNRKADVVREVLVDILHGAHLLQPDFLDQHQGFTVTTELSFPRFWGLGTSSTLINNIAQWFGVDAFRLLRNTFGGSGYDIACAQNDFPLLYQLENEQSNVQRIDFNRDFTNQIYFLYLNQKQSSKAAIASYYGKQQDISGTIMQIDRLTQKIINAETIEAFRNGLEKHEIIMSEVLEMNTVKENYFADFNGTIKSLGAWGGDFVMVVTPDNPKEYFEARGFNTLLSYYEMIL